MLSTTLIKVITRKKSHILAALGQAFTLKDRQLTIELQNPFLTIKNKLEDETMQKARLEMNELSEDKIKIGAFEAAFSLMSGRTESDRHLQFGKLE